MHYKQWNLSYLLYLLIIMLILELLYYINHFIQYLLALNILLIHQRYHYNIIFPLLIFYFLGIPYLYNLFCIPFL